MADIGVSAGARLARLPSLGEPAAHAVFVLLLTVWPALQIAKDVEATVTSFGLRGIRCLAVARTLPGSEDQWEMLGILTFLDPPRPDTKRTIERAMEYGVSVKMITGQY